MSDSFNPDIRMRLYGEKFSRTFVQGLFKPYSSFDEFQFLVSVVGRELASVLLYTDEDTELASYVREHFDDLHHMSGPLIKVFVLETLPIAHSVAEKNILLIPRSRKGLSESKPYGKSDAYRVARTLNIFPDELPCLAVFDQIDRTDKLVFPVQGELTEFFRSTFSNIQRFIPDTRDERLDFKQWARRYEERARIPHEKNVEEPKNVASHAGYHKRFTQNLSEQIAEIFSKLQASVMKAPLQTDPHRTVYQFFDKRVFINNQINTDGGAYVGGDVSAGKNFVGRDKQDGAAVNDESEE